MNVFNSLFAVAMTLALALPALAATVPNEKAPVGGSINYNLDGEPPTIHPIMSTDLYASKVQAFVGDTLANRDSNTYEWKPRIAEKWEISKDNKTFTFFLRKGVKFHDGKELTAEDVKFSFDAIFEPKYEAANKRPYYEGIAKVEVVDAHTVRFTAKDSYFKNFDVAAGLEVIPKHVYSDVEKSRKMTREYVGAGPFMIEKFDRGQMIVLKRFEPWFETTGKDWKGAYNYERMNLRFYKDETVQIERMKKGDLDYIEMRAEAYVKKAEGAPWGKTVLKKKVENSGPVSYGFIGWNFRQELFQDRNVRLALAHLLNREEIIKKFTYGMAEPARGPVFNKSEYASPNVKAIEFSPKKAQALLKEAGWKDEDKNGVLEKTVNGKKVELRFALIYPNKDTEKYWTLYREDLKRAGIDMQLKFLEWNSFLKILDEGKFDAAALAWGGGDLFWDPKQIWHSSSAVVGGSNFISYKNPEVDKLIDEGRVTTDRTKRRDIFRKVYELIAADAPYAFLTNSKFAFYGVSSRIGQPGDTFKYEVGTQYWWMKP
ncbi:MAG: peptide-binding protein [Bdellovibrionaceae bacterium]|nr:peptide-binding protein [Pseudobdellovibrionaceae bacterium]